MRSLSELQKEFYYLGEMQEVGPQPWSYSQEIRPDHLEARERFDKACKEWLIQRGYTIIKDPKKCSHVNTFNTFAGPDICNDCGIEVE